MIPESLPIATRQSLFIKLFQYKNNGFKDWGLLYLGARYAISLGLHAEAMKWIAVLEEELKEQDQTISTLPILLLQFLAMPPGEERDKLLENIDQSITVGQELKGELSLLNVVAVEGSSVMMNKARNRRLQTTGQHLSQVGEQLIHKWPIVNKGVEDQDSKTKIKDPVAANLQSMKDSDKTTQLLQLSYWANHYYEQNDVAASRFLLEKMLLIDGHQVDVLRNLLTICSEQNDLEAYERYWKKQVKLLLWDILIGEEVAVARGKLLRFYKRVITLLEREFKQGGDKIQTMLKRPGFLNRWIEASVAVVWLRNFSVGSGAEALNKLQEEQNFISLLLDYWLTVFYPEYSNRFSMKGRVKKEKVASSSKMQTLSPLENSSLVRLVSQYLKWYRLHFGLGEENNELLNEAIIAYANFIARIPYQKYLFQLSKKDYEEEDSYYLLEGKPLINEIKKACSFGLRLKFSDYLQEDAEEWLDLYEYLEEANVFNLLSTDLQMYQALAASRGKLYQEGLKLAISILPQFTSEDIEEEEAGNVQLWNIILQLAIREAQEKGNKNNTLIAENLQKLQAQLGTIPRTALLSPLLEESEIELSNLIIHYENQDKIEEVLSQYKKHLENKDYKKAKRVLKDLPKIKEMEQLKEQLTKQVDEVRENEAFKKQIEEVQKAMWEQLNKENYTAAKAAVLKLPDEPEEMHEVKNVLLNKIKESKAENEKIDAILKKIKRELEVQNFRTARKSVSRLSGDHLKKLRANILSQIKEAEDGYRVQKAIKEIEKHLSYRDIQSARRVVNQLPDSLQEAKNKLNSQLDQISNRRY